MAYFLLRLWLSDPPVESNKAASSVAGFLEARKADNSKYFADGHVELQFSRQSIPTADLSFTTSLPTRNVALAFIHISHGNTECLVQGNSQMWLYVFKQPPFDALIRNGVQIPQWLAVPTE